MMIIIAGLYSVRCYESNSLSLSLVQYIQVSSIMPNAMYKVNYKAVPVFWMLRVPSGCFCCALCRWWRQQRLLRWWWCWCFCKAFTFKMENERKKKKTVSPDKFRFNAENWLLKVDFVPEHFCLNRIIHRWMPEICLMLTTSRKNLEIVRYMKIINIVNACGEWNHADKKKRNVRWSWCAWASSATIEITKNKRANIMSQRKLCTKWNKDVDWVANAIHHLTLLCCY